ncbi:hybrid sensor histidine kinase/response regulator [Collinsella intestinalis]|uniref:hybrid sensor histidine kinase/response regulator n=1 Tax=Collinsella intestinalis TaxID=147207 RepID=UPI00195EA1E1|nr:hybrid sensor histidine kinase/response regulator [Collinsella intestinalis]MBM6683552.1 response regulator [Collinsella intestinalis]
MTRTSKIAKQLARMRLGLVLLGLFVALSLAGGAVLRSTLLTNAHESNTALSRYYASEVNSSLTMYRSLLEFGTESMDVRMENGASWEELEEWVRIYCDRLRTVLGDESINVYGVVDGTPLTAAEWSTSVGDSADDAAGDTDAAGGTDTATDTDATTSPSDLADPAFDLNERSWYRAALAADGEAIFTDVYTDAITGQPIVTVAQACKDAPGVLAFDLYPGNFQFQFSRQDLPEGASFFLCDGSGELLYRETSLANEEGIDNYVSTLAKRIAEGDFDSVDATVTDLDGRERVVDYTQLDNGWYSIVTSPRAVILGQLTFVYVVFGVMVVIFIVVLGLLTLRDARRSKTMERTNETVRVLGNSYYAIYLVNYEEGTYEMIKGSDYVRRRIPKKGPYADLLRAAAEVIERDTFEEFEESFSADNIRQLVAGRVRDYGGDFMRRFGEEYRWVNVRVLYDESLAPEEVVLCFRVVDQEKQHQLQERHLLEEALSSARQSMESKQAFFNNMSHDMRTPLNAVIGLTELASTHVNEPDRIRDYLERIHRSGKQLLALINDILDISRMETGSVSLNPERMDLAQVVTDCAEPFRLSAEGEGKHFEMELALHDTEVMGDPVRLSQVMNNLLSNAVKYTNPGDRITVRAEQLSGGSAAASGVGSGKAGSSHPASYRITVADTGIGMTKEFLGHLFELYAREQRFGTVQQVGTGLGMPITKNLIEQMGGTIEVTSEVDVGSTFVVTVPFVVVRDDAGGAAADGGPAAEQAAGAAGAAAAGDAGAGAAGADGAAAGKAAAGQAPSPARPASEPAVGPHPAASATPKVAAPAPSAEELLATLNGKRVLLAEDNAVNMEIAAEMLGMAGVEVEQAWNGREALEAFRAAAPGHFDAVLLDMKMPEMDGCAAARAIRALPRPDAQDIPLVAVTANAFAEDIVATTAAGMNAHVSKPIDFALLCQTLAELIVAHEGESAGAADASGAASPEAAVDAADPAAMGETGAGGPADSAEAASSGDAGSVAPAASGAAADSGVAAVGASGATTDPDPAAADPAPSPGPTPAPEEPAS